MARDRSDFSAGGVTFATADTALFGAVGGGQAGFNWQSGALVLGAEADFDWSNPKGSITAQCAVCVPTASATLEHDVDWFGTARARIGYAIDGWLAYATGGYAFGRVALKGTATAGGVSASITQNSTPSGWSIGGGTELALGPNWSAKLEYLYVDLGTVTNTVVVAGGPSLTDHARIQMNVVRAGVNYRFWSMIPKSGFRFPACAKPRLSLGVSPRRTKVGRTRSCSKNMLRRNSDST